MYKRQGQNKLFLFLLCTIVILPRDVLHHFSNIFVFLLQDDRTGIQPGDFEQILHQRFDAVQLLSLIHISTHYIRVDFREEVVLGEIRRLTKFASLYEDDFLKAVIGHSQQADEADRKLKEKELKALLARDEELDGLFERIYEDNVSGKISDERFSRMSRSCLLYTSMHRHCPAGFLCQRTRKGIVWKGEQHTMPTLNQVKSKSRIAIISFASRRLRSSSSTCRRG